MKIKAISSEYVKKYKRMLYLTVGVGVLAAILSMLAGYYSAIIEESFVTMISAAALFILMLFFLVLFLDLSMRKNVVADIGRKLIVSLDEKGIELEDKVNSEAVALPFRWDEIELIQILERTSLFERIKKRKYRVVSFVTDKAEHANLIGKYSVSTLRRSKKKELLGCYFEMEYRHDVMELVKQHWKGKLNADQADT